MSIRAALCVSLLFLVFGYAQAAGPSVGAAPKGDAKNIASRIIKENFPECRQITKAIRSSDGAIRARCDATEYLVFTLFDPQAGKVHEIALNCTAAKSLLNISC